MTSAEKLNFERTIKDLISYFENTNRNMQQKFSELGVIMQKHQSSGGNCAQLFLDVAKWYNEFNSKYVSNNIWNMQYQNALFELLNKLNNIKPCNHGLNNITSLRPMTTGLFDDSIAESVQTIADQLSDNVGYLNNLVDSLNAIQNKPFDSIFKM